MEKKDEVGQQNQPTVQQTIRAAVVKAAFKRAEEKGLVRFGVEPDECLYDDSHLDDLEPIERDKAKKELWDRIEREGVWGLVAWRRCRDCGGWICVDSVWGFVGHDHVDSGYDIDVMASALTSIGWRFVR